MRISNCIIITATALTVSAPANAMGPMLDAMGPYNMDCISFNKTKGAAREKALAYAQGIVVRLNEVRWDFREGTHKPPGQMARGQSLRRRGIPPTKTNFTNGLREHSRSRGV